MSVAALEQVEIPSGVGSTLSACYVVYNAMLENAEQDDEGRMVWVGMLTHLFKDLGYGTPKYTRITRKLKDMGCIEQLHRGAGNTPSEWAIHRPPEPELYQRATEQENRLARTRVSPTEQRIRDLSATVVLLTERIEVLETKMEAVYGH